MDDSRRWKGVGKTALRLCAEGVTRGPTGQIGSAPPGSMARSFKAT
jgi:hypothetical protein